MKDVSSGRGASALVLSGELTEGVSDMSQARTSPGGIPALPEVNQDRAHPDAPAVDEQPHTNYRHIQASGATQPGAGAWNILNPGIRGTAGHAPGPAQQAAQADRDQVDAQTIARGAKTHA